MSATRKRSHHAAPHPRAAYVRNGLTSRDARRLRSALDIIGDYAAVLVRVGRGLPHGGAFEGGAADTVESIQEILRATVGCGEFDFADDRPFIAHSRAAAIARIKPEPR